MMVKPLLLVTELNVSEEDKVMQSTLENPVSSKFSDLLHSLNYVADDLKIACAEASLEGDFTRVVKLSDSSGQIQAFINDVIELSNRWNKGVLHSTTPRKTLAKSRKHFVGKKPRSKLLITINRLLKFADIPSDSKPFFEALAALEA